ncbi:acyl-CoA/acyl-ACP dehydrogenase [Bacillus infantis]|uniref:acyl-CoA dehydrogenase family protein n=1 Tax=Bacillus infantis TaxID=324767 RepID=UPI001CD6FB17|nr:acyl-CoA dehydrogenase family protein [Bacillus infantis]MCA1038192.1 acyl-CoA/acyl-ACP dehydrogenase [Bacillus infantis]
MEKLRRNNVSDFIKAAGEADRYELMKKLSAIFNERSRSQENRGSFPHKNILDLKASGYTSLTVPADQGGKDISLLEMIRLQEKLAEGDGSTALAIGWHMGITKNLGEKRKWDDNLFSFLCREILEGKLINSAATERQTGSPARGGRPQTEAVLKNGKWVISGRKTFTTMAPALDYFIVSAFIPSEDKTGNFLVPRKTEGLSIEETWDSVSMRGTGSHDLVLDEVSIEKSFLAETLGNDKKANGWLLHIPAVYLGIAQAAQDYAAGFAKNYSPNSIEGTISDIPSVQQKIGEMELELMRAREFLYAAADRWDRADANERESMQPLLGAVKLAVTNAALAVADLAIRVVGARSLSEQNPLQQYYLDIRAGLHNPPMDDMTISLLARNALSRLD